MEQKWSNSFRLIGSRRFYFTIRSAGRRCLCRGRAYNRAVEPKAGQHYTRPTPDRCVAEFAQIMAELALNYTTAQPIHLVVDNLNIHCRKSLTDYYGQDSRCQPMESFSRFTLRPNMVAG